jgi:hypothetical protein
LPVKRLEGCESFGDFHCFFLPRFLSIRSREPMALTLREVLRLD